MKVCPKCGREYTDETQSFCLMDGSPLAAGDSQPTVVIPESASTVTVAPLKKKRGPRVWIALAVAVLLVGGAIVSALMFAAYRMGESAKNAQVNIARTSQSPRPSGIPRATPQPSSSVPAGSTAATPKSSPEGTSPDEVTPITWSTSGATFDQKAGKTYRFSCPPEGTAGAVWGSDIYTADSSICTAAVHAGKITLDKGGDVTVEFGPGRKTYGATTRNGITSYNFGEYPQSFVVR
jgi:hypothetical protein